MTLTNSLLTTEVTPDWQAFVDCIRRKGTPKRVHFIELFLDGEIQAAICERFGLAADLDPADPAREYKRQIAIQRFLGYDYVRGYADNLPMPLKWQYTEDTADDNKRAGGRNYIDEHTGPITCWADFEAYPWPDPAKATFAAIEWYQQNLPEDMCIIASGVSHFAEYLCWLMGYEGLCLALYTQRDLVEAIAAKLIEINQVMVRRFLEYDRIKVVWGSDDMGFKTQTMLSPADMRALVLPGHKLAAAAAHEAGRPYLLHSCGNLSAIMEDLIEDVRIDAKHSFEDTIESVIDDKKIYGDRIALLGGIDLDFLCRSDEAAIRARVRQTLASCQEGGGYLLGTGNSVANYIPLDNYLAMLDEGRRYTA